MSTPGSLPSLPATPLPLRARLKDPVKKLFNRHVPDGSPNVFVFTMPRSGSSWLMELIADQPGFKSCSEPLNLRDPLVRKHLGVDSWHRLHDPDIAADLERYFHGFATGRLHFLDVLPHRNPSYRFRTRRIVFKIIHGGEERISWFRDTFGGKIVYMLRHPIAVALSHEVFPRMDAYLESAYARYFSERELGLARRLRTEGSHLERGVLAWCFENAVALRHREPDWAVVTYEQLVLEPRPVVDEMIRRLELDDPARMIARLTKASGVARKSDERTRRLLEHEDRDSREALVSKWHERVDEHDLQRIDEILSTFGVDAYTAADPRPTSSLWIDAEGRPASGVGGRT